MIWGKRQFAFAEFAPYQAIMEKLLMANPALYQEFIMVSTKTEKRGTETYWVGVPNEMLLIPFDGFDRVEERELPKEIDTLLIADATKEPFTSRFKFVA